MALSPHYIFQRGASPIIAAAIHNGHDTRRDVEKRLLLSESQQLREEDPASGEWTQIAKTQIVGLRSRFEVDLNRPRDKAVYETPAEAWGLQVWDTPPDQTMIEASLQEYDDFYHEVNELLQEMVDEFGKVVVYDLHTYNHRRDGVDKLPAEPWRNPEVNVGTGTMDRVFWASVVDRLMVDLRDYDFHGRHLDVRENVKFRGGYFCQWIHETFPERACAIAIEFKKFFMNEWNGKTDTREVEAIYRALRSTVRGVRSELEQL